MSARGSVLGVILAGGASTRMGSPKALLRDARGRTFLDRLTSTLARGGCDAVVVVAGRHAAEIASQLPPSVLLIRNAHWERGQLSSARTGLTAAMALGARRVLLHPVDQPLIRPADVRAVLAGLERAPCTVAAFRGEPGHPLGVSADAARRLLRDRRAKTLRDAVERNLGAPLLVGASEGAVRGANTPAELDSLVPARAKRISSRG